MHAVSLPFSPSLSCSRIKLHKYELCLMVALVKKKFNYTLKHKWNNIGILSLNDCGFRQNIQASGASFSFLKNDPRAI